MKKISPYQHNQNNHSQHFEFEVYQPNTASEPYAMKSPQSKLKSAHPAKTSLTLVFILVWGLFTLFSPHQNAEAKKAKEVNCGDGVDNDKDSVADCSDSDCKESTECKPDGRPENTNERCRDWVDNDEDGVTDCDDQDCQTELITACEGSWDAMLRSKVSSTPALASTSMPSPKESSVELSSGDPLDLIGTGTDLDGERNDYLCSDGIDNDNDGKTDCEDPGCQFDGSVQVCRGSPNMRFSIVGQVMHSVDLAANEDNNAPYDTRISRLQLRTFGPIPQIENSFYLISMLTEKTPRLTFAMFSLPLFKSRHMLTLNSGAAGLSQAQALSVHKQLLVSRTNVFRAFEQFNSAAVEVSGPLNESNTLRYRVFGAGGNGRFDGNIGGRSLGDQTLNYPWSAGAQLGINLVGYYSRFDTPFLYVPVPLTVGLLVGGKYDRREAEEFYSTNVQAALRYRRFVLLAEHYWKNERAFESKQAAWHAQAGFLAIPKVLMLAGDFGQYQAEPFGAPPERYSSLVREPKDETQYRAAAHFFYYRDIGVFSIVYNHRMVEEGERDINEDDGYKDLIEEELSFIAQFRF